MSRKLKIDIDVDGVLRQWSTGLAKGFFMDTGLLLTEPKEYNYINQELVDGVTIRDIVFNPDTNSFKEAYLNAPCFKCNVTALQQALNNPLYELNINTFQPTEHSKEATHKWISDTFTRRNMSQMSVKMLKSKTQSDAQILADDNPRYIYEWVESEPFRIGFLVEASYNFNEVFESFEDRIFRVPNLASMFYIISQLTRGFNE